MLLIRSVKVLELGITNWLLTTACAGYERVPSATRTDTRHTAIRNGPNTESSAKLSTDTAAFRIVRVGCRI